MLAVLLPLLLGQIIPSVKQTQFLKPAQNLRDSRYCEIVPIFRRGLNFQIPVFNTAGLNDCPADLWARQNATEIAKKYNAFMVKLNGPRYWTMDFIKAEKTTESGRVVEFNGLQMRERATISLNLADIINLQKPYQAHSVMRNTVFGYLKGKKVYELSSPTGEVFRMQSYAQIVDPSLNINNLDSLGDRLKLPQGWKYQVKILNKDSKLKANGIAYVLQDDFQNSYQKQTNLP